MLLKHFKAKIMGRQVINNHNRKDEITDTVIPKADRYSSTSSSENHGMVRVGRDLWTSSSPTLPPRLCHLGHVIQEHIQVGC